MTEAHRQKGVLTVRLTADADAIKSYFSRRVNKPVDSFSFQPCVKNGERVEPDTPLGHLISNSHDTHSENYGLPPILSATSGRVIVSEEANLIGSSWGELLQMDVGRPIPSVVIEEKLAYRSCAEVNRVVSKDLSDSLRPMDWKTSPFGSIISLLYAAYYLLVEQFFKGANREFDEQADYVWPTQGDRSSNNGSIDGESSQLLKTLPSQPPIPEGRTLSSTVLVLPDLAPWVFDHAAPPQFGDVDVLYRWVNRGDIIYRFHIVRLKFPLPLIGALFGSHVSEAVVCSPADGLVLVSSMCNSGLTELGSRPPPSPGNFSLLLAEDQQDPEPSSINFSSAIKVIRENTSVFERTSRYWSQLGAKEPQEVDRALKQLIDASSRKYPVLPHWSRSLKEAKTAYPELAAFLSHIDEASDEMKRKDA